MSDVKTRQRPTTTSLWMKAANPPSATPSDISADLVLTAAAGKRRADAAAQAGATLSSAWGPS